MKKKLLALIPLSLALVACGSGDKSTETNDTEEILVEDVSKDGFPIVEDKIEMTLFVNKGPTNQDKDWDDLFLWNEYEDMTNIKINWEEVPPEALEERRNLSLVQNDLPDVFFHAGFPSAELYKYGRQEVFVELTDYIEEYAPNLSKLLDERPDVRKAITFPDGNIYSLPVVADEDFTSFQIGARPWVDGDILDELGLDVPDTTDELYEFLVKVKEEYPDKIPLGSTHITQIMAWINGSFGVQNRGQGNGSVDYDEEKNELRFFPVAEGYKESLKYMHKLYDEKLIDQQIFTIEWGEFLAKGSEEAFASMIFYEPQDLFGSESMKFMTALEGPDGIRSYNKAVPSVPAIGNFVITSENENPAAAVRWYDYFYSDEGSEFYYMGVEGETFEVVDGERQYVDKIRNPEGDLTFEQTVSQYLPWVGVTQGLIKEDLFDGSETAENSLMAADAIRPQMPEIWNSFTFTEEENDFLNSAGTDIEKYVSEMRDKFIAGDISIDDEWDNYLDALDKMGLDDYLEIYRDAFERYESAE